MELDAAYFHLYGIEREDVDFIMETFPIVRRKDKARVGEYRTKRLILDVYDRMAAAIADGPPFDTISTRPRGKARPTRRVPSPTFPGLDDDPGGRHDVTVNQPIINGYARTVRDH